jgi:hypothetical protein
MHLLMVLGTVLSIWSALHGLDPAQVPGISLHRTHHTHHIVHKHVHNQRYFNNN